MSNIFDGVRILDLTQVAAGPYTTMLFGYFGAEVIKIESPSRMDINRGPVKPSPATHTVYPNNIPGNEPWNVAAHHIQRNVNKLCVTLDLSHNEGKEQIYELIKISDVFIENFRASVVDRLGLDYDSLKKINPSIVYAKISSQGNTGKERNYGSLGSTLEQTGGLASVTGYYNETPLLTNETFPDPVVGLFSIGIIISALRRRQMYGQGCFIDLSQRELTINLIGEHLLQSQIDMEAPKILGNHHKIFAPQGVYKCKGDDEWISITISTDLEWITFCKIMDKEVISQKEEYKTSINRQKFYVEIDKIINEWTTTKFKYQVMVLLQQANIRAGFVSKGREVIEDPQLNYLEFWDNVNHPKAGKYKQVTTPWNFSRLRRNSTLPAHDLGQDNQQVFQNFLGVDNNRYKYLEDSNIIGNNPL
jgi:crotonobetainyl-CoA:carnitine CoA-transferase CaiB-like acyl-CoA transferase